MNPLDSITGTIVTGVVLALILAAISPLVDGGAHADNVLGLTGRGDSSWISYSRSSAGFTFWPA